MRLFAPWRALRFAAQALNFRTGQLPHGFQIPTTKQQFLRAMNQRIIVHRNDNAIPPQIEEGVAFQLQQFHRLFGIQQIIWTGCRFLSSQFHISPPLSKLLILYHLDKPYSKDVYLNYWYYLHEKSDINDMGRYELVAITEEVTTCEACGRTDLKKTLLIRSVITGVEHHYGSECAEHALSLNHKEMTGMVNSYHRQQREAAEQARRDLEWRIKNHPLMVQVEAEQAAFWTQTPRPSYAEYRQERAARGWTEMAQQARMEAAR